MYHVPRRAHAPSHGTRHTDSKYSHESARLESKIGFQDSHTRYTLLLKYNKVSPLSTCNTAIQTAAVAASSEERAHVAHLRATPAPRSLQSGAASLLGGCTVSCRLAYPPTQQPAHTHLVRVRVRVSNPNPNPNPSPRPDPGPTHLVRYLLFRHRLLAHAVVELHLWRGARRGAAQGVLCCGGRRGAAQRGAARRAL